MKKIGFLMVLTIFLLALPGMVRAASAGTHIYLDGVELEQPSKAQAGNVNGNIMVPLRVIIESLGYDVNWEQKTGIVTIRQGDRNLQLTVGSNQATVDGKTVNMIAAPILQNNSTLVPLRFVGEQTGLKVSWNNDDKSVHLYSPDGGASGVVVPGLGSPSVSDPSTEGSVLPEEGGTDQQETYIPETSTGNVNAVATDLGYINGISFSENRLMIAVSQVVEANVFTMNAPNRLVVDIPNVTFADLFKETLPLDDTLRGQFSVTEYPEVSQVRYSLFNSNPSTVRIVVDLNQASQFQVTNEGDGLVIVDLNGTSGSSVVQPGSGKPLVVIDSGHGGTDPGAISITNKKEKDFTLAVALKVEKLLQQESGLDFVLTRTTDTAVSLQERAKIANNLNAAVFVSIHGNSVASKTSPSGTETYYSREESIPFAEIMHKYLVKATGLPDRNIRSKSLHVTRETKMPAVLLEVGYLKNKTDEALMYSDSFQQRVAESIVAGIKEYLGL